MTHNAEFAGTIDITLLVFLVFVGFFFALVLWIRREDRREGYPLEEDVTGRLEPTPGFFFTATPKAFKMPHGLPPVLKPNGERDTRDLNLARTGAAPGLPYVPVGDPMSAGVGPGSYCNRARRPDAMGDGHPRLAPLRLDPAYEIDALDTDPRGRLVVGSDREPGGVVADVWVDRMEFLIRYLEVELAPAPGAPALAGRGRRVLVPMNVADLGRVGRGPIKVKAILGAQFANVPGLESPDIVTLYEEERIMAYFGAGYLYATPERAEPWL